jgi:hypothetical protein
VKLIEHFDDFLKDVVNLNDTRVNLLEDSIEALKKVVLASDWKPTVQRFSPQGSWAHKTIIKPFDAGAFDADLLLFVSEVNGWSASKYISSLRAVFANHKTYEDKVRRFSHCVTIEYAGERKIDLAPCVVNRGGTTRFEVCNYDADEFESSEPEKYTAWLIERNDWTTGNALRKVTRLLKYLRDIKGTFTCSSVLFTTLLGYRIDATDRQKAGEFSDVPTALKTVVNRLDDWLQARPSKPTVYNPVLTSETFSDGWDDDRYANFRERISKYRGWIDDAYSEPDRDESIGKWRRVFGDDFARSVVFEKAARVSDSATVLAERKAPSGSVSVDLVTRFVHFGAAALPPGFDRLPHKERPPWRTLPRPSFDVGVAATRHLTRGSPSLGELPSGTGPLPKHQWLRFRALANGGVLNPSEFETRWRVTNTDREATQARCLRGGFVLSDDGATRWESLAYRGVHTVETFVVRKRDQTLVAQSRPFYVVIE